MKEFIQNSCAVRKLSLNAFSPFTKLLETEVIMREEEATTHRMLTHHQLLLYISISMNL
jgi:hypothetical protein